MLSTLLGGADKKAKKETTRDIAGEKSIKEARDLFNIGRFPVVTTQVIESRPIAKVLGLVCCRGFDSEEAFFGMAAMAVKKGAQGIIGYNENVAFHPDGSKYFSCFGTAVMFQREGRSDLLSDTRTIKDTLRNIPTASASIHAEHAQGLGQMSGVDVLDTSDTMHGHVAEQSHDTTPLHDTSDRLSLQTPPKASQRPSRQSMPLSKRGVNRDVTTDMTNDFTADMSTTTDMSANMKGTTVGELSERMAQDDIAGRKVEAQSAHLPQGRIAQPTEEEDPVLQRLLASQKRQASPAWQH